MTKIAQSFAFTVTQPGTVWRLDSVLETPKLRFPLDEVRFCPQVYLLYGFSTGLTLYWQAVSGASFYVVQIADNQSFSGPNVRAIKTTDVELELNYLEHLRVGDQFFWRVAAYNSTGGASVMSEVRSVKIACPEVQGVSFKNEGSDYADIDSPKLCDTTGVNIELGGTSWVRKTDSERTWVLNVNYDCNSFEGHQVRIDDVIWEVRQSPQEPVTVEEVSNDYIKLNISSYTEEWFEIIAHVIFELVGVGYYECKAHKKVLIEGQAVGTGGGAEIVDFEITGYCPDVPGGTSQCVYATVLRVSCQASTVSVGDAIIVCDPDMCLLNLPVNLLAGLRGTAIYMSNTFVTLVCAAEPVGGPCAWKVLTLCCSEELYGS